MKSGKANQSNIALKKDVAISFKPRKKTLLNISIFSLPENW